MLITTKDMLRSFKKPDLLNLAKAIGVTGVSGYRKEQLIDKIVDYLLFPTVMYHRLSVLSEQEMAMFRDLLERDIEIDDEVGNVAPALVKTLYLSMADDEHISLMPGVKESYQRFAHDKFELNRKKVSWLYKCLEFASSFYGLTPIDILLQMYNQKPGLRISQDELLRLFNQIPGDMVRNAFDAGLFWFLEYSEEEMENLLDEQEGKDFFIPTHKQVEFYHEHGFFDESAYHKIRMYLAKATKLSFDEISEVLSDLFHFLYMEEDLAEIMNYMSEVVELEGVAAARELGKLINDAHNDTRMLENRGYTPNEMLSFVRSEGNLSPIIGDFGGWDDDWSDEWDDGWEGLPEIEGCKPIVRQSAKVYPNDPCPCGSNIKYKKCCGK